MIELKNNHYLAFVCAFHRLGIICRAVSSQLPKSQSIDDLAFNFFKYITQRFGILSSLSLILDK